MAQAVESETNPKRQRGPANPDPSLTRRVSIKHVILNNESINGPMVPSRSMKNNT